MSFDPSRVQAVLFDVDGTLADTDDEYIRRVGQFIRRLHFLFPQRDPTNFLRWSLMIAETPMNLLMGLPDWLSVDDELARIFDWIVRRGERPPAATPAGPPLGAAGAPVTSGRFMLMAGVPALLPRLAPHYPLGVVTARGAHGTEAFLNQFSLAPYFGAVASALTAPHTKPYPDPVLWAAQALGVPVEHCVMVGDTTVDILSGKRAGAQTVGVLCGFGERGELERAGANLILDTTAELGNALLGPPNDGFAAQALRPAVEDPHTPTGSG